MSELLSILKLLINQKLIGVTEDKDKTIQLHFSDWVLFVKDIYPSPIVERIPYDKIPSKTQNEKFSDYWKKSK